MRAGPQDAKQSHLKSKEKSPLPQRKTPEAQSLRAFLQSIQVSFSLALAEGLAETATNVAGAGAGAFDHGAAMRQNISTGIGLVSNKVNSGHFECAATEDGLGVGNGLHNLMF